MKPRWRNWQTRSLEEAVPVRVWRFKSSPRHKKMNKYQKLFIYFILVFSFLHTVRDILQIINVNNTLTVDTGSDKSYCNPYCDYIVFPFEIPIIIMSLISLKGKKWDHLASLTLIIFVLWIILYLWSYFRIF